MRKLINLLLLLLILPGCNNIPTGKQQLPQQQGKNDMADLNMYLVQKDREIIQNYIERRGLNMKESPTGFWYMIVEDGTGDFLKENDRITMNYECTLLDGTKCYSSAETGPREIILGRSRLEPGLNEGLRMLKRGGAAVFILPPFMAYGLVGDGKKIPSRATIVYTISILHENKME